MSPEYCLLGIVLNNPDMYKNIPQNIFTDNKCKELYDIIETEQKRSKGFTKETIINLVKENNILDEGIFYEIYDSAYDPEKFDYYFNHVLSAWGVLRADMAIKELRGKKYSAITDVKDALQTIINEISIDDLNNIQSSKDIIFSIVESLGKNTQPYLIDSHCSYIDSFGGFEPCDFVVIAARPGVGKSSLMYNLILNDMRKNIPCGLFSLEASKKKVYTIIGCIGAGINTKNMRTSILSNMDKQKLTMVYEKIYEREVLTVDQVNIDIHTLRRKVKIMKERKGIKKVYIDYFQLLQSNEGNSRYEQMTYISRELKKMAMDFNIVVIALAQLNRELEKRASSRPKKSDLRDTGSLEQDTDIVWLLYNHESEKEQENKDKPESIVLGNIIDKFREGAEGEFNSNFHKPSRRIKEWTN